ncbi:hypothetical protein NA57DRAFT_52063 [Rhizodiscina lignyota]|uniref:Uncharacterized protein n=1 Tax=Rhizodiscina lignyota TaxID=1504668 RepID=A0A9P4M9T9_9PEZI|nr:hypothetical protein NA57DRAFT_52063 [Rhizodiscina lignyota]
MKASGHLEKGAQRTALRMAGGDSHLPIEMIRYCSQEIAEVNVTSSEDGAGFEELELKSAILLMWSYAFSISLLPLAETHAAYLPFGYCRCRRIPFLTGFRRTRDSDAQWSQQRIEIAWEWPPPSRKLTCALQESRCHGGHSDRGTFSGSTCSMPASSCVSDVLPSILNVPCKCTKSSSRSSARILDPDAWCCYLALSVFLLITKCTMWYIVYSSPGGAAGLRWQLLLYREWRPTMLSIALFMASCAGPSCFSGVWKATIWRSTFATVKFLQRAARTVYQIDDMLGASQRFGGQLRQADRSIGQDDELCGKSIDRRTVERLRNHLSDRLPSQLSEQLRNVDLRTCRAMKPPFRHRTPPYSLCVPTDGSHTDMLSLYAISYSMSSRVAIEACAALDREQGSRFCLSFATGLAWSACGGCSESELLFQMESLRAQMLGSWPVLVSSNAT